MDFTPRHTETWGDMDYRTTVNLYMEDKDKYPTLEDLVKAGSYIDSDEDESHTSMFSEYYKTYSTYSAYDCTGQCVSIDRTISIVEDEQIWCIVQKERRTYDY